jgi:hypothetical protein
MSIEPDTATIRSVRRRQASHAADGIAAAVTPRSGSGGVGAVRERGGDVLGADDVGLLEVGRGAGDAEDAVVAAGAEAVAVVELVEEPQRARGGADQLADHPRRHLRVARHAAACEPARLALAGGHDVVAERRRGGRPLLAQGGGARAADRDGHVDAVEQRTAEPALVAREVGGGAAAAVVAEPARAGVRRGDEHAARREQHHPL